MQDTTRPDDAELIVSHDHVRRIEAQEHRIAEAVAAEESGEAGPRRLGSSSEVARLRAELAEIQAAAEATGLWVAFREIGRRKWRELKEKHPPRTEGDDETVQADRTAGVNLDSSEDDLVYAALTYPVFTSRGDFDEWSDEISPGKWQTLVLRAWESANTSSILPKSSRSSATATDAPTSA